MPRSHWLKGLIHVRDAVGVACLVLLALSELYSAVDLSLDSHLHLPAWEHPLGWALFLLPSSLALGLALLLRSSRKMLGSTLAGTSLLLYAGFIGFDAFQSKVELGDWIAMSGWCTFCALGIWAVRILKVRSYNTAIAAPLRPEHSE